MQPEPASGPFDDDGYLFEPWWPGVRALAYVDGGHARLAVEGLADAEAAFPEVGVALPACLLADGVILDGSVVVLDGAGRLDPRLLRERLEGGGHGGGAAFVASDLPWCDGVSWRRRHFERRRRKLESVLVEGDRCVVGRAFHRDGTLLAEALGPMGISAMSARRLDARYRAGGAGEAWLRVPIVADPAPSEPPRLALIQRLPLERP
jgi:bifunctional non-homologous end joining protein LigD